MASERHGKYLIVSRPISNPIKEVWHPYSVVMWRDTNRDVACTNSCHSHQFQNPSTFETQEEAVTFGFTVARAWIANKL